MKNNETRSRILAALAAVILTALLLRGIYLLSDQDGLSSMEVSDGLAATVLGELVEKLPPITGYGVEVDIRKYAHILEYAVLTAAFFLFFCLADSRKKSSPLLYWLLACGCGLLCAALDEWHQVSVPGRNGSAADVAIDGLGILGGSLTALAVCLPVRLIRLLKKHARKTS